MSTDNIRGKTLLIGVTVLAPGGRMLEKFQCHGPIVHADEQGVRILPERTGVAFGLPFTAEMLETAQPGTYNLRSTDETVENPDFLSTWTVTLEGHMNPMLAVAECKLQGFLAPALQ